MTEEIFNNRKENLKQFLSSYVQTIDKNKSIEEIIQILDRYNFNNRLNQKGALTHFVIDSAELDYNIGEKIIEFDNSIK